MKNNEEKIELETLCWLFSHYIVMGDEVNALDTVLDILNNYSVVEIRAFAKESPRNHHNLTLMQEWIQEKIQFLEDLERWKDTLSKLEIVMPENGGIQ